MKCNNCGKDSSFCPECGSTLNKKFQLKNLSLKSIKVIALVLFCMCSALAEAQEFYFNKGEHYRNIDWDESAFQEYVKGMKIGEAASALNVAYCYLDEYGTPRNIAKGEHILDTWANKDNEICKFAIIYYYHLEQYESFDTYYNRNPSRISDKPNYAKSLKFIKLYKAKTGKTHPIMGLFYLKGLGGVPVDTIKAIDIATEKYSDYYWWWPCRVRDVIYQYGMNSPTPERLDMLEKKYPENINEETKKAFNRKRLELSFGKNIGIDEFKNKLAKSMDLDGDDFYLLMKTLSDAATTEEQKNYINATRTARDLYNCCVNPGLYGNLVHAPKIIKELKSREYYNEDYMTTEDEEKYAFLNDFILPHLKYNNQCKSLLERISYNQFKSVVVMRLDDIMYSSHPYVVAPQKATRQPYQKTPGSRWVGRLNCKRISLLRNSRFSALKIEHKKAFIALLKLNAKAASMTFIESPKRPL